LERMVSNLSLYSELDFGRIRYRVLDITEFIGQMLNEYALDFKKAGIETETDIPKESIYINADSDKLKRVFSNIFDNTVKYRKSGMAGRLKVSIAQEDDFAVLAFSDNGIGMDAGDEKRAFETFFRADPARSMNVSGNGLGLSICDKIIKEHGGRIWIRSGGEGGGLTVYVRLAVLK
ncbi:MAG TPA: HAMP domain-containing histidine kinase, partial [Candidatus Monoglobus merdigallinarum]|nr:HAMP domain-containing histidine kinase [Candidatus Monoglobus merdigallinarum]